MRSLPLLFLLLAVLACSSLTSRNYDLHGIRSVEFTLSGTSPEGAKHYYTIVYHNTGRVEKRVRDFNADGSVKETTDRFGSMSTAEFRKIEDVVIKSNFFAKPDLSPLGSRRVLTVVRGEATKQVDEYRSADPEVKAVSIAVSGAKIDWDGPPKNVN